MRRKNPFQILTLSGLILASVSCAWTLHDQFKPKLVEAEPAQQVEKKFIYDTATLARIVDGDTVRLDIEIAPDLWLRNQPCRLLRVNTPELNTPAGQDAKTRLTVFLSGKQLTVTMRAGRKARDSLGRWLVELTADGQNVSDWLIQNGLGVAFMLTSFAQKTDYFSEKIMEPYSQGDGLT